jgi:hypothetical protein
MQTQTPTLPLRDLVRQFNIGQIQLPQFQRDFVWKPRKIRNLLDSLLRGYPIGGFYLWRPNGNSLDPKPKAFGVAKHIGPQFTGYLIDGQQRLTSLEAAFGLYTGEDKAGAELRCFLDLRANEGETHRDTRLFVSYGGHKAVARRVDDADPSLIPLSSLFDGQDPELRHSTEEALRLAGWSPKQTCAAMDRFDRACKMLDQLVPVTTVYDISDRDAVVVFDRLNKGGAPLRQGDVRAAELARGSAVNVLRRMREFVIEDLPQRLGFGFSFAFRALVVFHRGSAKFVTLKADWMDAPGVEENRSLQESWKATERALREALVFVERMGWCRRALLPSTNALIVLAYALDRTEFKYGPADEELFRRWLCLTAMRGVFQGSVETTINRFLKCIKDKRRSVARGLVDGLQRSEGRRITSDDLMRPAQMWGPATQVMHAWLVSSDADDWIDTQRTVDSIAREGNKPGGELTVHHTFPRRLLVDVLDDPDAINRPANFALISRSTNAELGDQPPSDVLAGLTVAQRKAAAKQFFGTAAGDLLDIDRYEEYCRWRAGRLAEALNSFIGL